MQMINVTSVANNGVRDTRLKFLRTAFCVEEADVQYSSFTIQQS